MNTKTFRRWDILLGWFSFAVALITYSLTLEPTVSYWDCGEYISTSIKLEVGHPPGAPLFQMIGAFFALFASSKENIALMVNFMSALSSAFTILFMFWSLTNLLLKVAIKKGEALSQSKGIAVLASALVGALCYTFTDSFWFSAVEAEVYAMSSFLMALLFWMGLKWESLMNQPEGNRWLLLICFVVGLSFGVHILSLLVIPSIVFLYIFKNYEIDNFKKFVLANFAAIFVLVFVFKLLFPYTLKFFSITELFFVNTLGLPFNSGTLFVGILFIALFVFGLKWTKQKNKEAGYTALLGLMFVMIGFSTWIMLPIRANANTIINENNPSSARELLAYYNREQYGDANIFYDSYYSIMYDRSQKEDAPFRDDKPKYEKDEKVGKYVIVNNYKNALPNYNDKHKGIIPRMTNPAAAQNYKAIAGIPQSAKRRPTFAENIQFMISYQFGYMYFRYLMWNFVGRQNDEQGNMDLLNGNWLSGISFIDEWRLGPQSNLPSDMENNKGRNVYFFLPLLFALGGFVFQLKRDKKNFYNLLLFFLFTGLAIIFYTNPKAFEPRERDYAVVGSFYIVAIWVGFGVYALFDFLKDKIKPIPTAWATGLFALLCVPVLMASQNWDDHNRSGKTTARFNAKSYLDSCDKDAILFTIGDNDTFPLWYMQEVENYRTDIKLVNSSLFATDWYIDQMKRKTYEADPIPSQLVHDEYKFGTLDVAYFIEQTQNRWDIKDFMKWIQTDNANTYVEASNDHKEKYYPTNKIRLKVDKAAVIKNGLVPEYLSDLILPYIDIDVDPQGLTKNRILMLDILANNNWKHPIYFTGGANADEEYIWLKDYLQLDGLCYKFVPIKQENRARSMFDLGRIEPKKMEEVIQSWDWDLFYKEDVYMDVESRKNAISFRNNLMRLAKLYIDKEEFENAERILDMSLNKMPLEVFKHYGICLSYPEYYYQIGEVEKARKVLVFLMGKFNEELLYYSQFEKRQFDFVFDEVEKNLNMYRSLLSDVEKYDSDKEFLSLIQNRFISLIKRYEHLIEFGT